MYNLTELISPTSNLIYPDLETSNNYQKWTRGESDPDGFFTLMDERGKFLTAASAKNTTITGNLHIRSGVLWDPKKSETPISKTDKVLSFT